MTLHETNGSKGLSWWVESPLRQVFRDTAEPSGADGFDPKCIRLTAARGETVTGQLVLRCTGEAHSVYVEPPELRSPERSIPESAWEVAWVEYFMLRKNSKATPVQELVRSAPDHFPDALNPGRFGKLSGEQTQPVFLQLDVPFDAPQGRYTGNFVVRALTEEGAERFEVPVDLEVLPLTLPEKTRLYVTQWMNVRVLAATYGVELWSEPFWKMLSLHAKQMARHRQNVILTPLDTVLVQKGPDGKLKFDFARLDRWIGVFTEAGVLTPPGRLEFAHAGARADEKNWEGPFVFKKVWADCTDETGKPTGGKDEISVIEVIKALTQYLEGKGLLERSMFHIADEPVRENIGSWRELSRQIREVSSGVKLIDAITTSELRGHLDVWVPRLNLFEKTYAELSELQRQDGIELWFYTCWAPQDNYPNRLMDYPLIKTRLLHWINFLYGATGFLHWGYNFWGTPFYKHSPGDNWIAWPGPDGPRSSLRYEAMRQGIEDYELFMMLTDVTDRILQKLAEQTGMLYERKYETRFGGGGGPVGDLWDPRFRAVELARRVMRGITDYTRDDRLLLNVRETVMREIVETEKRPWVVCKASVVSEAEESPAAGKKSIRIEGIAERGTTVEVVNENGDLTFEQMLMPDARGMFSFHLDIAGDKPGDPIKLIFHNGSYAKRMERSLPLSD
jgi:hypothetical protein